MASIAKEPDNATAPDLRLLSSNGNVEDKHLDAQHGFVASEQQNLKYKHVSAVHSKPILSTLTPGSSANPSFVGFRNLMVLVILVSNLRLMIVNFRKYGVLICVGCHDYRRQDLVYGALLFLMVPCHLFAAYLIESAAAEETQAAMGRTKRMQENEKSSDSRGTENQVFKSSWHLIAFAHAVNASFCLIIASAVVYYQIHHPGIGTLCELHAVIVWLKCCSYALTCRDLRHAYLSATKTPIPKIYASCPYPRNITLGNLCYFWWAPSLVYQPAYPRTERIRWSFVALRVLELAGLSIAIWIASAQYATPLLQNSIPIMSQLDVPQILERLMKLSSISLFCWLAGFYALFQSALNALAEIMRFADRDFYRDWWNSKNIRTYWTSWNRPVYHFMKRHIFTPLVARGCPPLIAQVLVFVFSGILHEMLVGIPTHNILGVAFAGMMFQLPLIFLTDLLSRFPGMTGPVIGNCTFWISFVLVGQPLAALLYFFAWQAKYGSTSIPSLELKWDWRFGRG